MKNRSLFHRAALLVAGALTLGACSRGQYAVVPKAPAYLGAAPVATAPRPTAPVEAAPVAAPTTEVTPTPAARPVAAAPAKAVPTRAATLAPAAATPTVAPEAVAVAPAAASAPAKLNLTQRLALKAVTKKLDKLARQAPALRQHTATASTERADGSLRQALVVGVIGLAIILLAAIVGNGLIYLIGSIVLIVALVLLLLYLINQV